MNQLEPQMSDALRRLNAIAPQGAPAGLAEMLKDEFRRHQARRKRNRIMRISLLAACLVVSVGLTVILSRQRAANTVSVHEYPQMSRPESIAVVSAVPQPAAKTTRAGVKARRNAPFQGDRFVALPTFDPAIPIDRLQLVRLDLPGRALQLVGYPVSEEFAERRVVADILLAQDGTPYALRLVRSLETKEQWQ